MDVQKLKQQLASKEGSEKFQTTPITQSIRQVKSLPKSAILYACDASSYWQFRVFLDGKQRKRSTKERDLKKAEIKARLIYADMLKGTFLSGKKTEPSSRITLTHVANSLWVKQQVAIKQGHLHKDKVTKDKYVYEKRIKPFFKDYDIKQIDAEALEQFVIDLAEDDLAPATQISYVNVVMGILNEAVKKHYITVAPPKPKIRLDNQTRGYFDGSDYTKLWQCAKSKVDEVYDFVDEQGKVYRRTKITNECFDLIMFMRNSYVRPTDIKVLKHKHVHVIERGEHKIIELRQPATKKHHGNMASNEYCYEHYMRIKARAEKEGYGKPDDYVFMPNLASDNKNLDARKRDSALDALASQFTAVLEWSGLRKDSEGKSRSLYSLRHTAIMCAIKQGLPYEVIAANARTSTSMITKFYGSHIQGALDMGNIIIDNIDARHRLYAEKDEQKKRSKDAKSNNLKLDEQIE